MTVYLHMTFKQLTVQLQEQGWRAYYIPDASFLVRGHQLEKLANRNLLEIQIYEGKDIIFVKTIQPPPEPKQTDNERGN